MEGAQCRHQPEAFARPPLEHTHRGYFPTAVQINVHVTRQHTETKVLLYFLPKDVYFLKSFLSLCMPDF